MINPPSPLIYLAVACFSAPCIAQPTESLIESAGNPRIAIIKADDLRARNSQWEHFIDLTKSKNVKISIGIITENLEKDLVLQAWVQKLAEGDNIEFWNHGWHHKKWLQGEKQLSEFSGSGYEPQKESMDKAQATSMRVLGKPYSTFGSPYNAMDGDTLRVIKETPALLTVFCYPEPGTVLKFSDAHPLPMNLRGENDGTGKPNFEKFKAAYEKTGSKLAFAAIQFHPPYFSEQGLKEFGKIIDFLKAEGWLFMLPSEYLEFQRGGRFSQVQH